MFLSATLLFVVELMVGKMILPLLGGTPAVWNTCMLFYQAMLLAGYCYAHVSTTWLGARRQAALHLIVLVLPFLTLSLTMDRRMFNYGEGSPIPGLLLGLLVSVGLPLFAVSTTAPLLQKWFANTDHPEARDPYFLYGASNLGSMVGLFGYPTLIEPSLTLANQRFLWGIGYALLAALTALCAVCLWRSREPEKETVADPLPRSPGLPISLSIPRRLRWVALAFVPSSLMLGATTYVTTDIAPVPLLWVLPLGLYLLSFILVFSRLPDGVHRVMVVLLPLAVLLLTFLMISELPIRVTWKVAVHLVVLFVVAMVCHGELARDRPPARYLTGFYLWMSLGGVLGGVFNALVAPLVFNGIVEYPLALVLACLLMPTLEGEKKSRLGSVPGAWLMGLLLGIGLALYVASLGRTDLDYSGLLSENGLWMAIVLTTVLVLGGVRALRGRDDRAARWLDLGLPAALAVLALGLSLGLRLTDVLQGLYRLMNGLHDTLAEWVQPRWIKALDLSRTGVLVVFIYGLPVVLCYLFVKRPVRFGLAVGALFLVNSFCELLDDDVLLRDRSFFGALQVKDEVTRQGGFRRLDHGTTLHGEQRFQWSPVTLLGSFTCPLAATNPLESAALVVADRDFLRNPGREPLTYFHRTGPIGQVFAAYRDQLAGKHVGLIGLGSGTLASYGQPGQKMTYYEIDPLIQRIAYNPAYFTFVRDALARGVELDTVLGDARLKLEERANNGPPDRFALLVVDAFSSDAIPIHLLTREALAIYLANLADDGVLAFHISNRYLDLEPVLGNLAAEVGLVGYIQFDPESHIPGKASSNWVVLARKQEILNRLVNEDHWEQWQAEHGWTPSGQAFWMLSAFPDASGVVHAQAALGLSLFERLEAPWRKLKSRPDVGVWTDDYSNLFRVFDWRY
jgi:hypothetical protein